MSPKLLEPAPALDEAPAEPNGLAVANAENALEPPAEPNALVPPDDAAEPKPDEVKLENVGCLGLAAAAADASPPAADVDAADDDAAAAAVDGASVAGGGDLDTRSFDADEAAAW